MKVLGAKVENELYGQFTSLPGPISDNLRKAVLLYLNHNQGITLTTVNQSNREDIYKTINQVFKTHNDPIINDIINTITNNINFFTREQKIRFAEELISFLIEKNYFSKDK